MFIPLKTPNIPSGKVSVVAISEKASDKLTDLLNKLGISVIKLKTNTEINGIGDHADVSLLNICEGKLLLSYSQKSILVNFLTKGYQCKLIDGIRSPYPFDCKLNCAIIGKKVICNPTTVSDDVLISINNCGYKIISVKQGYTKCSVCVLNDNALITDDESVYAACNENNIDSILIDKGSIKLDGFNYGFIGGCTGLIDKNKLLFNGDINQHKDSLKIINFLNKHNVEPIIIKDEPLVDIGSILPLCEAF